LTPLPLTVTDEAPRFVLPRRLSVRRLAAALAEAGYVVVATSTLRDEELYLDTQDGRLHRAGLRLSRSAARWLLGERGWIRSVTPAEADSAPPGPLAATLAELAGGRHLLPQAVVRTVGRLLRLRTPVGAELELAAGRWWFVAPGGGSALPGPRVATVETGPEAHSEAQHLGAVLRDLVRLRRQAADPLAAALAAFSLPLPGAPVPDALRLAGPDSMADAGRKMLARQAYKMRANTAGTIADLDPEFLHDLRVATRRARSALRLLVPLYGAAACEKLRAELGWIAEHLGAVRDLDVHLARLPAELARVGAGPGRDAGVTAALAARRGAALEELRGALQASRYDTLVGALADMAAFPAGSGGVTEYAVTPASSVAPELIARAARRVRRWGDSLGEQATEPELHRLRILFKRLRYTCEFFADLFGDEFRAAIARLVPFQDCLGALQDAVVARAVLADHAAALAAAPSTTAEDMLLLGALMQVQRDVTARRRAELLGLWRSLPALIRELRRHGALGEAAKTTEAAAAS
jgi:CHAD domain-containing protein